MRRTQHNSHDPSSLFKTYIQASTMWRRTLVALRKAAPAAAVAAAAAATIATQSTPCQAAGVQSAVQVPVPKPRSKDAYKGYDYSRLTFVDGKSPAMRGDMEEFILNLQDEICGVRLLCKLLSHCSAHHTHWCRLSRQRMEASSKRISGFALVRVVVAVAAFSRYERAFWGTLRASSRVNPHPLYFSQSNT